MAPTLPTEKVTSVNLENVGDGSKHLSKGKWLMAQAKTMVAMTRMLEGLSEARDNLLAPKHRNSHPKATSVEIFNIKHVVEMGVITFEHENSKVAELLGMK